MNLIPYMPVQLNQNDNYRKNKGTIRNLKNDLTFRSSRSSTATKFGAERSFCKPDLLSFDGNIFLGVLPSASPSSMLK